MAVYLHSFKNVELILFDFENNIGKFLKKKKKQLKELHFYKLILKLY